MATGAREDLRKEVEGRLEAVLAPDSAERLENKFEVMRLEEEAARTGKAQVAEKGAYTWFNRLCALRFMDAHGYTPTPLVTPREGSTIPAILADAQRGMFDPSYKIPQEVRERVLALLSGTTAQANATEAAYAELIKAACAYYTKPMPYLFSEDATSNLLMPQGLLAQKSILKRIVEEMDEDTCASVEVLGWLYQFYVYGK